MRLAVLLPRVLPLSITAGIAAGIAGCIEGEPVALPEPTPPPAVDVDARMVSAGSVTGYLGRPLVDGPVPGELLLVDTHDEAGREEVRRRAGAPAGVLAVTADVDATVALAYLDALPWTASTAVVCLRQAPCPEVEAPPVPVGAPATASPADGSGAP